MAAYGVDEKLDGSGARADCARLLKENAALKRDIKRMRAEAQDAVAQHKRIKAARDAAENIVSRLKLLEAMSRPGTPENTDNDTKQEN